MTTLRTPKSRIGVFQLTIVLALAASSLATNTRSRLTQNSIYGANKNHHKKYNNLGLNKRHKQDAEKQVKLHELMKELDRDHYNLFKRKLDKKTLALLARHITNLRLARTKIMMRQQKRKLGIFKFDKKVSWRQLIATVSIILLLLVVILFVYGIYSKAKKYFDEGVLSSITETSRDLLFIVIMLTVFNIVSQHNMFVGAQKFINVEQLSVGGLSILTIWILRAIIKVLYSQWKINKWDFYESCYPAKFDLVEEFDRLTKLNHRSRKQKSRLKDLAKKLEYFNLRDDFIDPHFLPTIAEMKYRDDFPFSDYLSLCLTEDLKVYFRFKKSSYYTIFFLLAYFMLVTCTKNSWLMAILVSIVPITFGTILIRARKRLNSIYKQCLTKSKHKDLACFTDMGNGLGIPFYPLFLKKAYSTTGKDLPLNSYKNKQEELFWRSSSKIMVNLLHYSEVVLITDFIVSFPLLSYLFRVNSLAGWFVFAAMVYHSIPAFFFAPGVLVKNAVTSNILLMRNQELAKRAINLQKERLYPQYRIFYRAMKILCRLTNEHLNSSFVFNSMNPLHKNQLLTVFQKISGDPDIPDRVSIHGIKEVGYLFGQNFTMDEWLIISKETIEKGEDGTGEAPFISYDRFIDYIEKLTEETKIDPYNMIKELLTSAEDGNLVSLDGDVNLRSLKIFLSQHRYLDDDISNLILYDVSFLANQSGDINIDQLCSYIRNIIEGFAR